MYYIADYHVGDAPFGDTDKMSKFEVFNNIIGKNVTYPMSMSSDLKLLLKGLLSKNPQERLAFRDIKQSSWVADVRSYLSVIFLWIN